MDERTANQLAAITGGEASQRGGVYVVTVTRDDGSLVVFSGDAVSEYASDEALDAEHVSKGILLDIPEADDLYVLVDLRGNVFYADDQLERGWRYEEDAQREAMVFKSRGEGHFSVVRHGEVASRK